MKRYGVLFIVIVLCFSLAIAQPFDRSRHGGELYPSEIHYKNALVVTPDNFGPSNSLQGAYAWLKSSDRNGQMGSLWSGNERELVLSPGRYTEAITLDTDYVNLRALVPGSVNYVGAITISSGVKTKVQLHTGLIASHIDGTPQRRLVITPIYNIPCDTASMSGVYGTTSNDTDYYVATGANERAIRQTKTDTAHAYAYLSYNFGGSVDLREGTDPPWLFVRFYAHEGTGSSAYDNVTAYQTLVAIDNAGTPDFNDYYLYRITGTMLRRPGWHTLILNPESITTGGGTPDWSDCGGIRFRMITSSNSDVPVVTLDQLTFIKNPYPTPPLLCIVFDDAISQQKDLLGYLSYHNLVGTIYVNPSTLGTSGKLEVDDLRLLKDAGHLIANHGWYHNDYYWNTENKTAEDIRYNFARAAEWLAQNGFGDGARICAMPGGSSEWKAEGKYEILGQVADQVRLTGEYYDDGNLFTCVHRFDLIRTCDFDMDNVANVITDLTDHGGIAVIGFHSTSSGWTLPDWKTAIDNIAAQQAAGNLKTITTLDLLQGNY